MTDAKHDNLFGLSEDAKRNLLAKMKQGQNGFQARERVDSVNVPDKYLQFEELPGYKQLRIQHAVANQTGILNPFFACHDGIAKDVTSIDGVSYLNFSTYDYLDLNGHPEIIAAAGEAMRRYGTSASASRLVSGERPPHRALEKALAQLYNVDACLTFVSGHATNVSTISQLFGRKDIIFQDSLAHNSIVQGATASGAYRICFPHNDLDALERLLHEHRGQYQRALIVTEGLFSMDGHIADLPGLIALKKRHKCFLMVDDAHGFGVLGKTGCGVAEHFGINPQNVDIWMGTLSKTLCGCGGFIAGSKSLIELLKFTASGFVYSVGMSPPLAAASKTALEIMLREPWRVEKLQSISRFFLSYAKDKQLNTGDADGYAIVPIKLGSSLVAGLLATALFELKVNVLPIIYPVVEEGSARLRFFLSAAHGEECVRQALDAVAEELPKALDRAEAIVR
ncbi:aminotransferase class I/II-fold pyridoxal phosphate-dependent enzyme [Desulfomicrobium sp. ZS1]|uniref:aminotransferase class I/II-fold pyridoxal phosphate-dependent enzyme n=1 Tax=Desulfomicrobium sp. ZS1 TaxID=2952228 RepID=UPI0020B374F1|nr:aminotransferase class I/II-fold pyridoxal phosphate-dependent enzyme [Desulfomicrobium sp. ZS1]UTF51196.1 aminotransferase class I/II-fold pyridoxal phosphate-dependent enzyme [Desulfomicrobium sp. ZS1]